jgi:hypothetical protein
MSGGSIGEITGTGGSATPFFTAAPWGNAGSHSVPRILTTDTLVSVVGLSQLTGFFQDITSQFTISGSGTIDNTGGTNGPASSTMLVMWLRRG